MAGQPVQRDLQLQAAVVRHHHLVAEAGGDQHVGLREPEVEQPAGPELAAELLVVGEVQLHRAAQRCAAVDQRAQRVGVGREVALAHRRRAAVELAVDHLGAIGVVRPAVAGRHHVAVGVERNRRPVAEAVAHDQVGDRHQARGLDHRLGHLVALGGQSHEAEHLGGALGVRCVVARRRVGGHAHQLLQEAHLFVEVLVDPAVEALIGVVRAAVARPPGSGRVSSPSGTGRVASFVGGFHAAGLQRASRASPRATAGTRAPTARCRRW